LGDFVTDFIAGKFAQVTDDKQIDGLKNNLQGTGKFSALDGTFQPDFYRNINYQDVHRYYEKLRHYSYGYARELTSYFRGYAEQFFKEPESLHTAVSTHKRAWILNAMRAFAVYWEYKTQGGKEVADLVYNIIRRYQLNRGLDIHHKIYLVDENHVSEKVKALMAISGDIGFVIKLGLFSGLREEELVCIQRNRASLRAVQKRNGTLTVIILNRFQAHKRLTLQFCLRRNGTSSSLYHRFPMKSTYPARIR
jgi:intergrase/recombinase